MYMTFVLGLLGSCVPACPTKYFVLDAITILNHWLRPIGPIGPTIFENLEYTLTSLELTLP
jgi:hypothetical protein